MHQTNQKLSDTVERKFIEQIGSSDFDVLTPSGFEPIISTNKTIEYEVYEVKLDNGLSLKCADTHILINIHGEEVFAKDSVGELINTRIGGGIVVSVENLGYSENMYDLSVGSDEHVYYTNDILSHNTTTAAAYILWYATFNEMKTTAVLAQKSAQAREILSRVQQMYENLPNFLKMPVVEWNKGNVEFVNGCKIFTSATGGGNIRGKSISFLYLDEFAWIPKNIQNEFMTSVYPTISSGTESKIVITSTPNGFNEFWRIWDGAIKKQNLYVYVDSHWSEVPGRDEKWKEATIKQLGSERKFQQEYACEFLGSALTLIDPSYITKQEKNSPIFENNVFRIYERPKKNRRYVLALDFSRGTMGDYHAGQMIDVTEFPYRQVAVLHNNEIQPIVLPNYIHPFAKEYNEAFIIGEINDNGQAVLDALRYDIEYDNLLTTTNKNGKTVIGGGYGTTTRTGLRTDRKTKRVGCLTLKSLVETGKLELQDEKTLQELFNFTEQGASWAASDGNDDLVMSLVVFAWLTQDQFFTDEFKDVKGEIVSFRNKQIEEDLMPIGFADDSVEHFVQVEESREISRRFDPWFSESNSWSNHF